ncbi:unnamed protein product [Tilletia controversa]|uniref:Glycoside hydrolase family 5 domain-containing protein n=2 Tax=Tilletia TaxID=13289 RepID=A0A177UP33_9BASI|nr:hypothetical protein CF336_g2310 [Tilletia laevis]KAE8263380.1 hypothetical protein A4X03_0g1727 [Tilletia caries]CAD6959138.1 unnamed protein product [Tilletia controversa]KAE8206920.1 hypothetical protein CF335_g1516 [Tilletia laevis]CAD6888409.1 unnamed protein product [Tilletia caries]
MKTVGFGIISALAALVITASASSHGPLDISKMHRVQYNARQGFLEGELAEHGPTYVELNKRAFNFGTTKVRGVNLGGWLVAEPWITPSLFSTVDSRVVDEWTFGQYIRDARRRLQRHWATFITENTFREIAAVGYLNMVRIPISYWAVETSRGEPYVRANQLEYLARAVGWAKKYGLNVMIDLHGAPGSQNGFDNSGQHLTNKTIYWNANSTNAARTKAVLVAIARRYVNDDNVVAIEVLNEPASWKRTPNPDAPNLLTYYRTFANDAYYALRYDSDPGSLPNYDLTVVLHNAFRNASYWNGAFQPPVYQNVVMDIHRYTMFSPGQNAWSHNERLQFVCSLRSELRNSARNLWTIIGEWTTAPNDCAQWLNGRGRGSRYEGEAKGEPRIGSCYNLTGNASRFSPAYKSLLKAMFDTQTKLYEEMTSGWIMWTWITENAPEWSFREGVRGGWIPRGSIGPRSSAYC